MKDTFGRETTKIFAALSQMQNSGVKFIQLTYAHDKWWFRWKWVWNSKYPPWEKLPLHYRVQVFDEHILVTDTLFTLTIPQTIVLRSYPDGRASVKDQT